MKTDKRTKKRFSLVLIAALASVMAAGVYVFAGDLDSPGAPAAAVGRMYTIEDIYDLVTEGTFSSLGSGFTESESPQGFEIVTGTVDSATANTIFDYPLRDYATGYFIGCSISITGGTGSGQIRYVSDFTTTVDGGTVTVRDWDTTPSTDSTYRLSGAGPTLTDLYQATVSWGADAGGLAYYSLATEIKAEVVCVTYPGVPGSNTALMWAKKKAGGGCYSNGTLAWADVADATRPEPTWSDSTKTYTYPGGTTIVNYPAFEWAEELVLCDDGTWSDDGAGCGSASALYSDWRLPEIGELADLYSKRLLLIPGEYASDFYWSSDEYSTTSAWKVSFAFGYVAGASKTDPERVRAVRDAE